MKITYNNPQRAKERANVVPTTMDDMHNAAITINILLNHASFNPMQIEIDNIQNILDHYQNLQHFYDAVGGWEGYGKLKSK